jgi:hypothetical protein
MSRCCFASLVVLHNHSPTVEFSIKVPLAASEFHRLDAAVLPTEATTTSKELLSYLKVIDTIRESKLSLALQDWQNQRFLSPLQRPTGRSKGKGRSMGATASMELRHPCFEVQKTSQIATTKFGDSQPTKDRCTKPRTCWLYGSSL